VIGGRRWSLSGRPTLIAVARETDVAPLPPFDVPMALEDRWRRAAAG
jgi:hypothetical protein